MNSIRLSVMCIFCSVVLSACSTQENQDLQQIVLNEVTFLVPLNFSITKIEATGNGAVFEIEGWWGELRDHRLIVMGNNYGEVKAGDEVQLKTDGTFLVNGSIRESAGLGDSVVEKDGVLFFFPGRSVQQSMNEEGSSVVEMPDGTTYELTNGGIIIKGHEYGPFSSKTIVKVDPDGSVAFNP